MDSEGMVNCLKQMEKDHLVGKDLRTQIITEDDLAKEHRAMKEIMPAQVWLGPFMVKMSHRKLTNIMTSIAFWLLKKAGWELINGKGKLQ